MKGIFILALFIFALEPIYVFALDSNPYVGPDRKVISRSKYEYFTKPKAGGEEWTYKLVTELDGTRTETNYNLLGLPDSIKQGSVETTFKYDTKGHVTKKTSSLEIIELEYDPKHGKVSKVATYPPGNPAKALWSKFEYDDKGNLFLAKNSSGKGVKLLYDNTGRISSLIDQDRRVITFKYNEKSKPVEIRDPSLGAITVSYADSGEILKVDSPAGNKIAAQVTNAFQNLLEIIRPAGVTLSL